MACRGESCHGRTCNSHSSTDIGTKGLSNEPICSSALYYYDSDNVTYSHLAFHERVNDEYLVFNDNSAFSGSDYEQYRYHGIKEIFGISQGPEHDV